MIEHTKNTTFEEKELELLRKAVDTADKKTIQKIKLSNDITSIIKILETFLRRKKVICYGGTAINSILPDKVKFYNKDVEIPDYDFFSPRALTHAKELAELYVKNGYHDVEVRSGMHKETYKVFVNFIPIADITQLDMNVFNLLLTNSIRKDGIYFAAPDYLRMQTYNELARPNGDVSRWEKIYKRLLLLNKYYPFIENPKCSQMNFMRDFSGSPELNDTLYTLIKDIMINEGVIFLGGYASTLYARYDTSEKGKKKVVQHVPDFDVLSEDPLPVAYIIKEKLENKGFKNVKINKKPPVGNDIIMTHYEIVVGEDTVCFIYEPYGCFSYNTIKLNGNTVKIATIETMLLFLIAFLYSARPYYDTDRIICMAQFLINIQAQHRLEQKGVLKRFNINCYGTEKTIIELRSEKAEKYAKLKQQKESKEYNKYFFKYTPADMREKPHQQQKTEKFRRKFKIHKGKTTRKKNLFRNVLSKLF